MRKNDMHDADKEQHKRSTKSPFVIFFVTAMGVILMLSVTFVFVIFKTDSFMVVDSSKISGGINTGFNVTTTDIIIQKVEDPTTGGGSNGGGSNGGGGGGGGNPPTPGVTATDDVIVNEWLWLHAQPSCSGSLDTTFSGVAIYNASKWSMGEGSNQNANHYMRKLYPDDSYQRPTFLQTDGSTFEAQKGSVNASGRYWVAIGPSWFSELQLDSDGYVVGRTSAPTAGTWFPNGVGKEFDLQVNYNGNTYYIYCVCGDAKAHTYGDGKGYIQTGCNWNKSEQLDNHRDYSIIEWIGVPSQDGTALNSIIDFCGIRSE